MVPAPRARVRDGHLQRRLERRRGRSRRCSCRCWRSTWGWQSAFIVTGLLGLVWVVFWLPLYDRPEQHPRVVAARAGAGSRATRPSRRRRSPGSQLLPHRQTWAFAVGKFLTDPIWWFYLFWSAEVPRRDLRRDLKQIGLPLIVIYLLADVGSVGGGWLSSSLIKRGWSVNAARKTAMLVCALGGPAGRRSRRWRRTCGWRSCWSSLAAAAHQGFSANLFTLASDMFPRRAVGSVVGIGGMAGAVGGILFSAGTGQVLQRNGATTSPSSSPAAPPTSWPWR